MDAKLLYVNAKLPKFTKTCDEENDETKIEVTGDWQMGCKDVKMRMVNLYYSDSWADCTFSVGSDQLVPAHRVVLASASPVFAAMFYGGMPENSGPIHVEDIEPDTFIELLRYIYTDNTDIMSINDACALYYAAKKYMLLHLKTECLEYLLSKLTAEDCCLAYEFAQMFDEKKLLNTCVEVMQTKTKEVLLSAGFLEASLKTVHFIYSMNNLAIESEMDLFEALERYVKFNEKCEESGQSIKITESVKDDNIIEEDRIANGDKLAEEDYGKTQNGVLRGSVDCNNQDAKPAIESLEKDAFPSLNENKAQDETVNGTQFKTELSETITARHVLKLIRFLTMTAEEFTNLIAESSMLTQPEILSILINIINQSKAKVPMPEGFSTELKKRCIKKDLLARNMIKFSYTVPECEYLKINDDIYFPQVHGANCSWILKLTFDEDTSEYCNIYVLGTGPKTYTFTLILHVLTKKGVEKSITLSTYDIPLKYEIGTLQWNDLVANYLEDGALRFEVEIVDIK